MKKNIELIKHSNDNVISLTLGIISIVFSFWPIICIPSSILAITIGTKFYKKTKSQTAKAGLITGIVGVSIGSVYLLLVAFYIIFEYIGIF